MADVFISYKREDRPLVRPLVRALQERGFTVWWDSRIETGENWMTCIKRALDCCRMRRRSMDSTVCWIRWHLSLRGSNRRGRGRKTKEYFTACENAERAATLATRTSK